MFRPSLKRVPHFPEGQSQYDEQMIQTSDDVIFVKKPHSIISKLPKANSYNLEDLLKAGVPLKLVNSRLFSSTIISNEEALSLIDEYNKHITDNSLNVPLITIVEE